MKIIMRPPSDAFRRALSKHPLGGQIDPEAARRQHEITIEIAEEALDLLEIDDAGLERFDRRLLTSLSRLSAQRCSTWSPDRRPRVSST